MTIVRWEALERFPGRGVPVPPAADKPPKPKAAFSAVQKALAKRLEEFGDPDTYDDGARVFAGVCELATAAEPPPFDEDVQVVALKLLALELKRRDARPLTLAKWWTVAASPASVVGAIARWSAWKVDMERWGVIGPADPYGRFTATPDYTTDAAFAHLRAWLGGVDEAAYAAAVARAREGWKGASAGVRSRLAFLLPTEMDLRREAFAARGSPWIAPDADAAEALIAKERGQHASALLHVLTVDEALPRMLRRPDLYLGVLLQIATPEVASTLSRRLYSDDSRLAAYFERNPALRPHLVGHAALAARLDAVAAAAPEAPIETTDAMVPALLATGGGEDGYAPAPFATLTVRGVPLSRAHRARLAAALGRSHGRRTAELDAVAAALDPIPAAAAAARLYADCASGSAPSWWMRSLWLFLAASPGPLTLPGLVDRIAADVDGMEWNLAVAALELALETGGDVGLRLVADQAVQAKKRGVRHRAAEMIRRRAAELGISADELADRLVPTDGLSPEALSRTLPVQVARLTSAMIEGRTWSATGFDPGLIRHPVLGPLARALVWIDPAGVAFRVDESGGRADADDAIVPGGTPARIAHPVELDPAGLARWRKTFDDHRLIQPFDQLARPVYRHGDAATAAVLARVDGGYVASAALFRLLGHGWTFADPDEPHRLVDEIEFFRDDVGITLYLSDGLAPNGTAGAEVQQVRITDGPSAGEPRVFSELILQLARLRARPA